jgi:hypothetical protein
MTGHQYLGGQGRGGSCKSSSNSSNAYSPPTRSEWITVTAAGPDSHWESGEPPPDPPEEFRAASSRAESGSHLDQQDDEPIEAYDDGPAGVYEDESPGSDLATGPSRYQAIARLSANPDAVEVFRSIGQMFDALRAERQLRIAADEQRRHLEVSNARLEAELELERTLRRLAEGELVLAQEGRRGTKKARSASAGSASHGRKRWERRRSGAQRRR